MKRMLNLSIRIRLSLIFTSLFMLLLLAVGLGLYFVVSQTLDHRLQQELYDQAESLLGTNARLVGAPVRLPGLLAEPAAQPDLNLNEQPNQVVVPQIQVDVASLPSNIIFYYPDGALLADTSEGLLNRVAVAEFAKSVKGLADGQGRYQHLKLPLPNQITNYKGSPQEFLLYARSVYGLSIPENEQSPLQVVALYVDSRSYEETATLLATMSRLLLIGLPVALVSSLLIGILVAGRALRPIGLITETARQIGATDLNRRIGLKSGDELGRLSQTFDEMIERLQNSFSRQRRFLADASHELRAPLAVIEAEATLMLRRPRDQEDYQRALELVANEAERLKKLLDEMMLLAQADSGELELRLERVMVEELVEEVVERLSLLAGQQQQSLEFEDANFENKHWLMGDRELLISLFYNLLSNAVKYTPAGGKINVSIEETSEQKIQVKIRDNGPGIPSEHLPYLFDRFYRVDRARTRSGSSGLGLSIAQWVAEQHGGRIEVMSEPGQGSVFIVILPLA